MIVVPRNNAPYTVFGSDGSVHVYKSKAQVVKAIGWYRLRNCLVDIPPESVVAWLKAEARGESLVHAGFYGIRRVVLDVFGNAVGFEAFQAYEPHSNQPQRSPGSRNRKVCCMRYPKTYSERRMNSAVVEEDGEVRARFARTGKSLADDRSDRKRILQRSWKVFRNQQWRD